MWRKWGRGRIVALRKRILWWWDKKIQEMTFQNKIWFCFENVKVRKRNSSGLFNYMEMSAWHIFIVLFFSLQIKIFCSLETYSTVWILRNQFRSVFYYFPERHYIYMTLSFRKSLLILIKMLKDKYKNNDDS